MRTATQWWCESWEWRRSSSPCLRHRRPGPVRPRWERFHQGAPRISRSDFEERSFLSWRRDAPVALMDKVMMAAFRSGNNERDIVDALKEVPVERAMLRVVRAMAAAGVEMVIVSDANSMFIEKILAHHGVGGCFSEVNTNEGKLEGGALRVLPHHQGPPHNCVLCPENLCKGMVLDKLRSVALYRR
mmetsp:Transcript_35897/g.113551  ORF Transcript_35897/g.113551 Transcript_35897/m.113551 type:complete len:187 (-) Transcript_35897:632-1192(-)